MQEFLRTQFALPRGGGLAALAHALEDRKFLFVVDDVWTVDQLDAVFAYGQQDSRVIVTRDLATARQFADTVLTLGKFTAEESGELLKISPGIAAEIRADATLNWLLEWPLGASLLRAALEGQSSQSNTPEQAWNSLRAQLQRSGLRLLDQPEPTGRNGSLDLSLRESLGRLQPETRKLLMSLAKEGEKGIPVNSVVLTGPKDQPAVERKKRSSDRPPARTLVDLGLAVVDGETLHAEEIVHRWLVAHSELTGDTDAKRKQERRETLDKGYAILRGKTAPLSEMEEIAYRAKDLRAFSLARKLLALARQHPDAAALPPARKLKMLQQHALCLYKTRRRCRRRLSEAFQILNAGDLSEIAIPCAGDARVGSSVSAAVAITGQHRDLEHSLNFTSGRRRHLVGDFGLHGSIRRLSSIARQPELPSLRETAPIAAPQAAILGKITAAAARPRPRESATHG